MAQQTLRFEDWEGVFGDPYASKGHYVGHRFGLYAKWKRAFTFRDFHDWRELLLALKALHAVWMLYLYYRQRRALQRAVSSNKAVAPKILQNVIGVSRYISTLKYQLHVNTFQIMGVLYRFLFVYMVVAFEVLPRIWDFLNNVIQDRLVAFGTDERFQWLWEYDYNYPILVPVYYITCTLLWIVFTSPLSYYHECILEGFSPSASKCAKSAREWSRDLLTYYAGTAAKIGALLWTDLGRSRLQGRVFHDGFDQAQDVLALLTLYHLFFRSFVPPRWFGHHPMREGQTKKSIEEIAEKYGIRLEGVYTVAGKGTAKMENGLWLRKRVIVPLEVLDKCTPEEVVALVVMLTGSWTIYPLVHVASLALSYSAYVIQILVLAFNWENVNASFGQYAEWVHPFQVVVLMLGGALSPISHVSSMLIYENYRRLDVKADALAVQRGFGKQLAKALIALKKDDLDVVVADGWYLKWFECDTEVLGNRLKRLGWTGEEDLNQEKDDGGHWEGA